MIDGLSSTALGRWISAWLGHQRALGRDYSGVEWSLRHLHCIVVERRHASDLDQTGFDLWCDSFRHLSATTRRGRQLIVRKFCLYRQRTERNCFVPDPLYFVRLRPYRKPIIVEPEQVARMLAAADKLLPTTNSPLRPAVMHLAVVLLYTAGLRRGELVRLNLDDADPKTGILRVRESKFHKSRLVPLSPSGSAALRTYLRQRFLPPFPQAPNTPLLSSGAGGHRRYTGAGLGQAVTRLFISAKVVDEQGRTPRIHDLRHSFAVQALQRWYRAGADVQSNLPRLAMYMGHVSIVSTAHYLHFLPTMRELASTRFEAAFGDLVEEASP